ncbi:MAG TPA: ATP-binding protein, partial [Lysobacter sp.]|nr:ATP-binding protein [Lysobacter sp.]
MSSDATHAKSAADLALHRLDFLARAGELLASSLDYGSTLQHVARLVVPELADLCVIDVVDDDGVLRRVVAMHALPAKRALLQELARHNPLPGETPAPAARVLASGHTELVADFTPELLDARTKDAEHARLVAEIGLRSYIAAPMIAHGDVVGVLSLGISESARRYDRDDRMLAEELARRAGLAIENARLYRSAQHEIEQRRRIESELRLSEQRFRAIMEQSPLSTQRLAPDGRTIGVNRAFEALWGLALDDLDGYSVLADPQLEATGIAPLMRRAFDGTPTYLPAIAYDRRISLPGAGAGDDPDPLRWVSAFAYPVRDDAGDIREVVLVHEDVTELRRSERRLRASEDRLNRALAAGGMVVWDWDLATGHVECSANAREIFGIEVGQRDAFLSTLHPEDAPLLHDATARALEHGGDFGPVEYRLRPVGGGERWVQSSGTVEHDADGRPARMLGVTVDTTARRLAEDATRVFADAGEILGTSLDYAATLEGLARVVVPRLADWFAVDLVDDRGELQRVAMYHPDPAREAIGREVFERYPPRRGDGGEWRAIDTRQPVWVADITPAMLRAGARDAGHARLLLSLDLRSCILVPLIARGTVIGVLTLVHAESGRRYAEGDVAIALDLARRAAAAIDNATLYHQLQHEHRRKDEFLATLAHELRNPLAPIRTGLALLETTDDPALAARTRAVMSRQLGHMVRLIDDLLDLARVTRGTIELKRRPVDVGTLVAGAVEASRPLLDAAGLALEVDMPEPDRVLDADDTRLSQVLTNLLNNAAKFTPAGGRVTLRARASGDRLRMEVEDTGLGLAPDQVERIFEMFVRGHGSEAHGGLGIGLTLARRLVELHGGRLWAESDGPGRGSRFIAELPVASCTADEPATSAVQDAA